MLTPIKERAIALSNYQHEAAFICSDISKVCAAGGAVSLAVSAFFGYEWLYPATFTGFCFCAWAGTKLSQTPEQEILHHEFRTNLLRFLPQSVRQYLDNSPPWIEFKKWPPVSNDHTLPPPDGIWNTIKSIFSSYKETVEVRAYTNGINLKYKTFNLQTHAENSGNIQFNCPIKEMMELLKNCFVSLENDGTPVFSYSCHTLPIPNRSSFGKESDVGVARLLLRRNDLIWNIYKNEINRVISTQHNSLSRRCSEDTLNYFKNSIKDSLVDRIRLAKECVISDCNSERIYLEPIHHSSQFHKDVLISKFMWAVTLIRYDGPSGNHAEIVVEGINDGFFSEQDTPIGKYFVFLADLKGEKEIKEQGTNRKVRWIGASVKSKIKLKYEARSTIWKRPSKCVKEMINEIVKERDNPKEGFAIYGRHSIFVSNTENVLKDSCITWAISKLSMLEIRFEESPHSWLFTNTSHFTKFKPNQDDPKFNTFLFFFTDDSKLI